MTMSEWFCEFEFNMKNAPGNYAGKLTHGDVEDLLDDSELTDDEWWEKHGSSGN